MRVIVKNESGQEQTLFINWRYERKKKTVETYCTVFENDKVLAESRTYVHKGDTFVKATGRKNTLAKVVSPFIFPSKSVRTQIWAAYKTMVKNKF